MTSFDGENFTQFIIIFILVALFFFGSRDIIGLTTAPAVISNS
jgi:hypothetical protein